MDYKLNMKNLLILLLFISCKASGQYLSSYQYTQVKGMINTAIAPLNTSINNLKMDVANLKYDVANKTLQIKSLMDSINNYKILVGIDTIQVGNGLTRKMINAHHYLITAP